MEIPKKIHQVWIGFKSPPDWCIRFGEEMQAMHPDWEYKLWTHDDIFNHLYKDDVFLQNYLTEPETYKWAFIADRVRLLLLRDFGGVYCDLDAKPIRSFDVILDKLQSNHTFFAGMKPTQEHNTLIDCTVLGSVKNGRVINECLDRYETIYWAHGCKTFNDQIIQTMDTDVALFGYEYFYNDQVTDNTIILHDVEETRLFSWVDDVNYKKNW
ncbi:glycosyltransferase [bacterium]|nr:glycosyltransferase [bacterium]